MSSPRTQVATSVAAPGTTATLLLPPVNNFNRAGAVFQNTGAVDVYIGGPGVTASTGFLLKGGQDPPTIFPVAAPLSDGAWYGVTASGSGEVRVVEFA